MSGFVTLKAKLKIPMLPNFLFVEGINAASLDAALAHGDGLKIDVGTLDDQAISDFCNAWTLAFTRHVKARRAAMTTHAGDSNVKA